MAACCYSTGMLILAIESSCDETAVAVVGPGDELRERIKAHVVRGQMEVHADYAGVVPELAARAHGSILKPLIEASLKQAHVAPQELDAIAATTGPGLMGGLLVGAMMGKTLAMAWRKPFLGINHLEGHILTPRLSHTVPYPYLALLTSGGHCLFVLVKSLGDYQVLGQTRDDAAGEAFDKVAKLLDLGFPGGPAVEKAAQGGNHEAFDFPRPLINQAGCDLSFAGLKTAVRNCLEKQDIITERLRTDIAASAQAAIGDTLAARARHAMAFAKNVMPSLNQFVVVGGVAANLSVRAKLEAACARGGYGFTAPPLNLCTDNAAMIGWAALERAQRCESHGMDSAIQPRWPLENLR